MYAGHKREAIRIALWALFLSLLIIILKSFFFPSEN
jgi:hypothetical protein